LTNLSKHGKAGLGNFVYDYSLGSFFLSLFLLVILLCVTNTTANAAGTHSDQSAGTTKVVKARLILDCVNMSEEARRHADKHNYCPNYSTQYGQYRSERFWNFSEDWNNTNEYATGPGFVNGSMYGTVTLIWGGGCGFGPLGESYTIT
jgi:hypothetical protein